MDVAFVKMEGAGNDYIYVDAIRAPLPLEHAARAAQVWSDRHFGIGADGLIVLLPSSSARVRMAMWNADGSRGRMCGNGLRCIAKLAYDHGHVRDRSFVVETDAGLRSVQLVLQGSAVAAVVADMGRVQVAAADVAVEVCGHRLSCVLGDAGNPHAVVFVDGDPDAFPVIEVGAAMQQLPQFRGGVNVEFVQVQPDRTLRQRTFERGSGETLACGTGAAVAALAAMERGLVPRGEVRVRLRGGDLIARCSQIANGTAADLVIEGPARTVFYGSVPMPHA
jgi:diaminopimelate epimerase